MEKIQFLTLFTLCIIAGAGLGFGIFIGVVYAKALSDLSFRAGKFLGHWLCRIFIFVLITPIKAVVRFFGIKQPHYFD